LICLESKPTATVLSKPPTYRNKRLEQMIDENKNESYVDFSDKDLTNDDMEIVAYYLLRNNTVSNVVFVCSC